MALKRHRKKEHTEESSSQFHTHLCVNRKTLKKTNVSFSK